MEDQQHFDRPAPNSFNFRQFLDDRVVVHVLKTRTVYGAVR